MNNIFFSNISDIMEYQIVYLFNNLPGVICIDLMQIMWSFLKNHLSTTYKK